MLSRKRTGVFTPVLNKSKGDNNMNELMYSFRENKVRVVMKDNEPWFVAKDVCDVLEIVNSRHALTRLDEDEINTVVLKDGIGNPNKSVVNEYGLYSLILGSRKTEAKEFKRWVTHEVLPSIRKTGSYSNSVPKSYKEALLALVEEVEAKEKLEQKIALDAPKVILAESIENSSSLILIGELAKILKQNGVEIGQNRLFERLRDMGYLVKSGTQRNLPTQRSIELGLFRITEGTRTGSEGTKITKTTKVTGKGQVYFVNKFLKEVK